MQKLAELFHNKKLLDQALQLAHKGRPAGYERLEFLGDRVVGIVVAEMLYDTFPNEKEGDLAKRFVALVREETLAEVAIQIGLPALLKTSENELRHNTSVLSDVCESVLGALYLDAGLDAVKQFMRPIWTPLLLSKRRAPQDPKSTVQEWTQKHFKELPIYTLIDQTGPDHHPVFTVTLSAGPHTVTGRGHSKKEAEQQAAQVFMETCTHGH